MTVNEEVPGNGQAAATSAEAVEFDVFFGGMSMAFAASFFITLLLGAVATFTATDFSMDKDKIIAYYGFFNPCLVFDHYPAKALAMAGMGFFLVIGLLFSVMFFVYVYLERRLTTTVWSGIIVSMVTIAHLLFINVFTVNLYPETRRLHGIAADGDAAFSMAAVHEHSMPAADIAAVELHTKFYILWLVAEIVLMLHISGKFFADGQRHWKFWMYTAICVFGAGLHALAMLVMVLQNRPKVDWYFKDGGLASPVQYAIVWLDAKSGASLWGWLPIMFYRYLFSTGTGIRVKLSMAKGEGDEDLGRVQPGVWFGRSWMGIAAIFALGGIFTPMWLESSTTSFKIVEAMRSKPFGYIAAPVYLACVVYLTMSVALTTVQQRLLNGKTSWPLVWAGMTLCFSTFACVLIVLEEEHFTKYFYATSWASAAAWILILNNLRGRLQLAVTYVVAMVLVLLAVVFVELWFLYYVYLALLVCVRFVSVHESQMFLSVTIIDDPDEAKFRLLHGR